MSQSPAGEDLLAACYRGLDPLIRLFGASEGGSVHAGDGALSCIAPLVPLAALFNSTMFDRARPESLAVALERMWPTYDDSGVATWSAWIVEGDAAAERIAEGFGMTIDSSPRAMGVRLDNLGPLEVPDHVEQRWDMATAAALNERGYLVTPGLFGAIGAAAQPPGARCFIARADRRPVAVAISLPNDEDCAIAWVSTDPEFQGRGHARAVLSAALAAARADGFITTTLQASKPGAPLYARLGYEDLGVAVNLWQYNRC